MLPGPPSEMTRCPEPDIEQAYNVSALFRRQLNLIGADITAFANLMMGVRPGRFGLPPVG